MKKSLLVAFFVLVSVLAHAQSPRTISYQGLIRGATIGNHSITITLYSDAAGTEKLWQSTTITLLDSSSVFNTMLGSANNPLPDAQSMDRPLWLGISLDGSPELRPLSQLTASPYSLNVADSTITASKMGTNYVSSISVNGQQITGIGSSVKIVTGNGIEADWVDSTLLLSGTGKDTGNKALWVGSGGTSTTNPCGSNSDGGVGTNTVAGGCVDSATAMIGYATISGGDSNTATGTWSTIGGGFDNSVWGDGSTIAGGGHNSAGPGGTIGGGGPNYAAEEGTVSGGAEDSAGFLASVGGGEFNQARAWGTIAGGALSFADTAATVGGGGRDSANGDYATIAGGYSNNAYDSASTIAGGLENQAHYEASVGGGFLNVADTLSAIPGGYKLELGNNSFGFNGLSLNPSSVAALQSNIAYFGNVDLEIASNDTIARQLRIFVPNSTNYTSFQEAQSAGTAHYILPVGQASSSGQVLTNDGTGRLSWGPGVGTDTTHWALTGNYGTHPPTNFLGTLDSNSLEFHIFDTGSSSYGNKRVMRFELNDTSANLIGGFHDNAIDTIGHPHIVGVVIAGGGALHHADTVKGSYGVISGGRDNMDTAYSVVSGGIANLAMGSSSVVVGGTHNAASGDSSFIGGGNDNAAIGSNAVIAGGSQDTAFGTTSAISGGSDNVTLGQYAAITGGVGNRDTLEAFVGSGDSNKAMGIASAVVGGVKNTNESPHSSIVSGVNNSIIVPASDHPSTNSMIGAGENNKIQGDLSQPNSAGDAAIVAGSNNLVTDSESFIGAGSNDTITEQDDFVVAGTGNRVLSGGAAGSSGIGAGDDNTVIAGEAMIGAGEGNTITGTAGGSFVGAGINDQITGEQSFAGAGNYLFIYSLDAGAVSGYQITIDTNAAYGFDGAGAGNVVHGSASFVGTGVDDSTFAEGSFVGAGFRSSADTASNGAGKYSGILAGEGLRTQSYAQTALGFYNIVQGSTKDDTEALSTSHFDDKLVTVGNGQGDTTFVRGGVLVDSSRRSDAFTVANGGYTSAYDNIGTGHFPGSPSGTPTRMGSTYADNTIEAWGNVPPRAPGDTATSDIGVANVHFVVADTLYYIILNVKNQDATNHTFTDGQGSITTSIGLSLSGNPGWIMTTGLVTSGISGATPTTPGFTVITYDPSGHRNGGYPFQFHVVAK